MINSQHNAISRQIEVYRADDKTLVRQAANDTVVLKSILPCCIKYPVVLMLKKYPAMPQK